jgi:hypothetical protein
MTARTRRKIDAALKAKIALGALREQVTVSGPALSGSIRTRFTPGRSSCWIRRREHLIAARATVRRIVSGSSVQVLVSFGYDIEKVKR